METKSSIGEYLKYMQENQPHLFEDALDAQIQGLSEAAEQDTKTMSESKSGSFEYMCRIALCDTSLGIGHRAAMLGL